jgi:hypothetical protein
MRIRLAGCVVAVCGVLAAGCGSPGAAAAVQAASAAPRSAQQARPVRYLGVYERGGPQTYAPVEEFARTVGRQPNITLLYSSWWEKFQASYARKAYQHGASVFVDINPAAVSVASIAAGQYDATYLDTYAKAVRAFGHRVIISFGHEPNGKWYSWGYTHTPAATWIRAWRHIVTVFRKYHATNVTWLWIVNRQAKGEGPIRDWWPGSNYVTWAGIDGYYESKGQTFARVFGPTLTAIRKVTRKPILISETAVGQVTGQAQAIPGLLNGVRRRNLLGLVWFDKGQSQGGHHQNWRLEGHPAAIAAFRRALHG